MTDRQVYERALAELRQCEEEMHRWKARQQRLQAFLETYEELVGTSPPVEPSPTRNLHPSTDVPEAMAPGEVGERDDAEQQPAVVAGQQHEQQPTPLAEVPPMAEAVLRETGHPLTGSKLYDAMVAKGLVIVGSKRPVDVLITRLGRSGRFFNERNRGYWIKGEPMPVESAEESQAPAPAHNDYEGDERKDAPTGGNSVDPARSVPMLPAHAP